MKSHRKFIATNVSLVAMFIAVLLGIGVVIAASTPIHKTGTVTRTITPPPETADLINVSDARLNPNIAVEDNNLSLVDYQSLTFYFIVENKSGKACTVTATCAASSALDIAFVSSDSTIATYSMGIGETIAVGVMLQFTDAGTLSGTYSVDFLAAV